jgi:CheY-like chemotaxis protein
MPSESALRGSVLLVEDDDDQRELARAYIEAAGYVTYTACNGAEALAMLPSLSNLCLIIVDLHMPIMDGRTLIRRLRRDASASQVPVVVHSSADEEPPSGIFDFVRKPSALGRLLEVVRIHCGD